MIDTTWVRIRRGDEILLERAYLGDWTVIVDTLGRRMYPDGPRLGGGPNLPEVPVPIAQPRKRA